MATKKFALIALILCSLVVASLADTPANCTYEDIRGVWRFYEGPRGQDKNVNCTGFFNFTSSYVVVLDFPDAATDLEGNQGFWTVIYNQGFEVVIKNRKYFGFSYFVQDGKEVTSYCDQTFSSTSHDVGENAPNWSCIRGQKMSGSLDEARKKQLIKPNNFDSYAEKIRYHKNAKLIEAINGDEKVSWKATHYDFLEKRTLADIVRMAGGKKSRYSRPKPTKPSRETVKLASGLPDSFDWRNVSGVNYVSPIRDQGTCGSCYAYGSMAMQEARLRIKSLNQNLTIFSTQDIVECSAYSQGCEGGFPYLVAGKYTEDYGLVEEKCNPYRGKDGPCTTDPECKRHYGTNYRYVGGFYGACNEELMRISLVQDGPIAVSFQVYDDFLHYKSGIYHHTGNKDELNFKFNPWEITNHVVLIVGYGKDEVSGQKFWIVKNSWSTSWGENGFFRIRRGNDECSIESIAVEADINA